MWKKVVNVTEIDTDSRFLADSLVDNLYSSSSASVQPNALVRTALFTPKSRKKSNDVGVIDLTESFREITYFKKEGYDSVIIVGAKLNVKVDFKVWCGIVLAFSKYGISSNKITLKFTEFAKLCGYKTSRIDKPLRTQLKNSLFRLQGQQLQLQTKDSMKAKATGLLLTAQFDVAYDIVELMADENLWELYVVDRQVLISLNVLSLLPYSEAAQCLYLFFASLPADPFPISYERMRMRLQLNMADKEANRSIRNAIKKLEGTGYLNGHWVTFYDESAYKITRRNKVLI